MELFSQSDWSLILYREVDIKKIVIVSGIIFSVIGFSLHFSTPSTTRSGLALYLPAGESAVQPITFPTGQIEYDFGIEFMPLDQFESENRTIVLVDALEYQRFRNGTPINELDVILRASHERTSYNAIITSELNLYVIGENGGSSVYAFSYYYRFIPSGFFETFSLGMLGVFIVVIGLAWMVLEWKRYFLIGLGVNLVLFTIRVFTLYNYSLGITEPLLGIFSPEMYNDYQFFYLAWVPNLLEGSYPYSVDVWNYIYPPLWIYSVSIFGSTPSWLPGVILFSFNMASGPVVYKLVERMSGTEYRN
jgi:hypothetical protein